MNRGQFLKVLSTSFGIMSVSGVLNHLFSDEPPVLSVAEGSEYAAITRSAITALGGMQKFVKQGSVVVVKPNLG